jgi:hypothetical protein
MTRRRLIFYGIFGAFHLITFIFTLIIEYSDASSLFSLIKYIGLFKYIAFIGLALIITDFAWVWFDTRSAQHKEDAMRLENNTLKAKVYDMQEAGKPKTESPTPKAASK